MKYNLTLYKDKNKRNTYAKDSCNVCHGLGIVGIRKPVTGQEGMEVILLCRCCKTIENDNDRPIIFVRRYK